MPTAVNFVHLNPYLPPIGKPDARGYVGTHYTQYCGAVVPMYPLGTCIDYNQHNTREGDVICPDCLAVLESFKRVAASPRPSNQLRIGATLAGKYVDTNTPDLVENFLLFEVTGIQKRNGSIRSLRVMVVSEISEFGEPVLYNLGKEVFVTPNRPLDGSYYSRDGYGYHVETR